MSYFHEILLAYGFTPVRADFYVRPAGLVPGGTCYCSTGPADEQPRRLLLWQAQRILLQGDVVTRQALEQVLARVLRPATGLATQAG